VDHHYGTEVVFVNSNKIKIPLNVKSFYHMATD
jgi:hypothetical protein